MPSLSPSRLDDLRRMILGAREGVDDADRFAVRTFAGPARFVGAMEPLRVAHLTDQHVGRVTAMAVQHKAVDLALASNPDVVVLTGDFVCHSLDYLEQLRTLVARFDRPTFAVLGNHDHWSGAAAVRRALRLGGSEVLDNAHTVVTIRGQRLNVVGLDDAYTGNADRRAALKGLDTRLPTLGLSHIAEEADGLWAHGVPLVLSGHTHAGQVTFAGLNELMIGKVAGHKYVHGLYGNRSGPPPIGAVYVGAGIGSGVVTLRLGERTRREVAIFELGKPVDGTEHHGEQVPLRGRKPPAWLVRRRRRFADFRAKRVRPADDR